MPGIGIQSSPHPNSRRNQHPHPHVVSWSKLGKKLISDHKKLLENARKKTCHRGYEYSNLESYARYSNSGRMKLESFERAKRRYFELCPTFKLGYMQKRLEDVITIAFLRRIFQDDIISNLKYLSKKYLINELNDAVAILFPRRSGKTEGCAWLIAVICVSQPHGNCIMYNLTHKQAKEFLQTSIKHLNVYKDDDEFGWEEMKRDERIMIEIKTKKYGTNNSIKSYPSALKGDAKIGCVDDGNVNLKIDKIIWLYMSVLP
jgi:hypothetical protein